MCEKVWWFIPPGKWWVLYCNVLFSFFWYLKKPFNFVFNYRAKGNDRILIKKSIQLLLLERNILSWLRLRRLVKPDQLLHHGTHSGAKILVMSDLHHFVEVNWEVFERSRLHNGRTVAPEAILFESPCRAHPETKIAQIICQGRDFHQLFYYSQSVCEIILVYYINFSVLSFWSCHQGNNHIK